MKKVTPMKTGKRAATAAKKRKSISRMVKKKPIKKGATLKAAPQWPPTYRQVKRMIQSPTVQDVITRLERTPARVGVSAIDGVGLIAIRPIKKGEKLYTGMEKFGHDEFGDKIVPVPESAIAALEKRPGLEGIGKMVRAYSASYEDESRGEECFGMCWRALDSMCPMWFINDGGKNHNVKYLDGEEEDGIEAIRDIEVGEELLSNFEHLGEGMDAEVKEYPNDAAWVEAKAAADSVRQEISNAQKRLAAAEAVLAKAAYAAGGHMDAENGGIVQRVAAA